MLESQFLYPGKSLPPALESHRQHEMTLRVFTGIFKLAMLPTDYRP